MDQLQLRSCGNVSDESAASSSAPAPPSSVIGAAGHAVRADEAAHAAGGCGSSFRKLGDGPWIGTVFTADGGELTVEELASGWKVTDETGKSWTGRQLEQLLKRVLA